MEVPYKNHKMNSTNEASYQNFKERENERIKKTNHYARSNKHCWKFQLPGTGETFQKTLLLLYSV